MNMVPPPPPETVLRDHRADVQALAFAGCRHLFSGDIDGVVKLWDLEERRPVFSQTLHAAQSGILSLQLLHPSAQQAVLISAARDGEARMWAVAPDGQLSKQALLAVSSGCYSFCRPHALLPAARSAVDAASWLLACAGPENGDVAVWDMRMGAASPAVHLPPPPPPTRFASKADGTESSMPKSHGMAMSVQLLNPASATSTRSSTSDGCRVLAGYESGGVALWDCRAPSAPLAVIEAVHSEPVLALQVSPDASFAVSGSADSCVGVLSIGQHTQDTPGLQAEDALGRKVHSSPVEAGSSKQHRSQVSHPELQLATRLELLKPGVGDVTIRDDGRIFAVGGWDGKVRVYAARGARTKLLANLGYHSKEVAAVRFVPMFQPAQEAVQQEGCVQVPQQSQVASDRESAAGAQRGMQGEGQQQPCWSCGCEGVANTHTTQGVCVGLRCRAAGLLASASRDATVALWRIYPPKPGPG